MTAAVRLAAIRFKPGDDIDALLADVAEILRARGADLSGALHLWDGAEGDCRCAEMDLQSLSDGRTFRISQPLGPGSEGCRLDPGGLAACAAALEGEVAAGCDLLILNRFGRGEAEGRGFRDLIGLAVLAGIPVLTAVRDGYAADWAQFGEGISCELPPDRAAILAWYDALREEGAGAGAA